LARYAPSSLNCRRNREVLEQMRQAERDAWSTDEHRLGDRDRELREQQQ
jgi:hypothetical protein